jgi:MFS family permease
MAGLIRRNREVAGEDYARLWASRSWAYLRDAAMPVTLAFAALSVGHGASSVGVVLTTLVIARLICMLPAGAIGDHFPRRTVLVLAETSVVIVQVITGLLLITDSLSVAGLAACTFAYGAATSLVPPALAALLTECVDPIERADANARLGMAQATIAIAVPGLAGIVIAGPGPGWSYLFMAAASLVSAGTLLTLPARPVQNPLGDGVVAEIAAAWKVVSARSWFLLSTGVQAVGNFAYAFTLVLGPTIAAAELGGAKAWGVVSTCAAVGSVLGAVAAGRLVAPRPLVAVNLALALTSVQGFALVRPLALWLVCVAAGLTSAAIVYLNQTWNTVTQNELPADSLARATSFEWMISLALAPIGYALVAPVSSAIGAGTSLVLAGLLTIAAAVVGGTARSIGAVRSVTAVHVPAGGITARPVPAQTLGPATT